MSTSIKIRKNINMSSKNIVFKGAETGKFAKSPVGKRPKVNMGQPIKLALNSIPATNVVKGDVFQIAKMNVASRTLGSIPTVVGSQELFKPENLGDNAKENFGKNVYHETSGVHEGTKQGNTTLLAATKDVKIAVYGWEKINGKWKYHDGTKYAKGWKKIEGKWYYFDRYEYMVTGWRSINGQKYYFHSKGDMVASGWIKDKESGKYYYTHGDGRLIISSWKDIDGKWYYFEKDGAMVASQTKELDGKEYSFNKDGEYIATNATGYKDSTKQLIIKYEGKPFLEVRINDNSSDSYTIGYGYDFSEKSDPNMFNKYLMKNSEGKIIKRGVKMTQKEAEDLIKVAADKNGITKSVDNFIQGQGAGNNIGKLNLTQNQYDALFSYFYSNGGNVFSDEKYNEWVGYGGEYAERAKARKELRDYIINNNGNYDKTRIEELFVNSKGGNKKYDYKERRTGEAHLFMQ